MLLFLLSGSFLLRLEPLRFLGLLLAQLARGTIKTVGYRIVSAGPSGARAFDAPAVTTPNRT